MIQTVSPEMSAQQLAYDHVQLPHILLILDQFPKTLGGGERIVLRLAALLPQYGYRVSILTFYIHPESTVLKSPPCPIYLLPLERTYDATAVRAAGSLRRFLKGERIDIVQTFFESSDIWGGFVAKMLSGVKLVWSRRDMGILRSRKHEVAYRLMADMPDAVFAVSEQVRRHCIEVDGIDPVKVETIYNGLSLTDWKGFERAFESSGKLVVLTVGNIRRVKGHDVLIRAAAYLRPRFPDISFRVAGDVLEPGYFDELNVLIHDLGVSDCFQFLGGITQLQGQLEDADVFVLPSRSEGFSNAIVEAMAASLPVVATDVGGNAEAVRNGVSGVIVPSEDPVALAEGLALILRNPMLAEQMGKAGRQFAIERFTTESMMKRITRTYSKLLSSGL